MKHYAERDVEKLDEEGDFYFNHLSAMTTEGLHRKADIAAELAYRYMIIERLKNRAFSLARNSNIVLNSLNYSRNIPKFRFKSLSNCIEQTRKLLEELK